MAIPPLGYRRLCRSAHPPTIEAIRDNLPGATPTFVSAAFTDSLAQQGCWTTEVTSRDAFS